MKCPTDRGERERSSGRMESGDRLKLRVYKSEEIDLRKEGEEKGENGGGVLELKQNKRKKVYGDHGHEHGKMKRKRRRGNKDRDDMLSVTEEVDSGSGKKMKACIQTKGRDGEQ